MTDKIDNKVVAKVLRQYTSYISECLDYSDIREKYLKLEFPEETVDDIMSNVRSITDTFRLKQMDIFSKLENDELSFKDAAYELQKLSTEAGAEIATYTLKVMLGGFELVETYDYETKDIAEGTPIPLSVDSVDIKKLN